MTCPECGQPIEGLGKCWTDGCTYDARDEPKKAPTPKLTEDEIQRQVKDLLHLNGLDYVDTSQGYRHDGSTRITPGLSDLIVFGKGRMCFAELKTPQGRQTPHQKKFQKWCKRAGVEYYVWRSVEDAKAWIQERAA